MKPYSSTDTFLHWLSQPIAKANRAFVTSKNDDSHTNLAYDPIGRRLCGRWFKTDQGIRMLTLAIDNFAFQVIDQTHQVTFEVESIRKTRDEVEASLAAYFSNLGLSVENFQEKMHYEIPAYGYKNDRIQPPEAVAIDEWMQYRQLANTASLLFLHHTATQDDIRIWPHHFDTGVYVEVTEDLGLGFGLAMQDEMVGAPYFYLSAYRENGEINYHNLPQDEGWRWIVNDDWKGAVLPLDILAATPAPVIQEAGNSKSDLLHRFIQQATQWFLNENETAHAVG